MTVKLPDPILKAKAKKVVRFNSPGLIKLIAEMTRTMIQEKGIGIAAPQIGVGQRVIIVGGGRSVVMINPEIIQWGKEYLFSPEGCLSVPNDQYNVFRCTQVTVQFQRLGGTKTTLKLDGLPAIVVQHEIDHLNGVTIDEHALHGIN